WAPANAGLSGASSIVIDPQDTDTLYAAKRGDQGMGGGGVWKSADGGTRAGRSWNRSPTAAAFMASCWTHTTPPPCMHGMEKDYSRARMAEEAGIRWGRDPAKASSSIRKTRALSILRLETPECSRPW